MPNRIHHLFFSVAMSLAFSGLAGAAAPATAQSPHLGGGFRAFYENSPASRPGFQFAQQGPLDWPAAEMREVGFARARAAIARYDVMRARQSLNDQIDRMKRRFEQTPEFVAARQDEDDAWAAYQSARDAVLARLSDDAEYAALVQLTADISARIADARLELSEPPPNLRRPTAVSPVMIDLASSKLDYARRATGIRSLALAEDAAVAEALARVQTASARVRGMRAEFNQRIRDDAAVLAAREQVFEARVASVAAAAYEDSARLVRRLAWDYARFLHRNDAWPTYGPGFFDPYFGFYSGGRGVPYDVGFNASMTPVGGYGFKRR